MTAFDWYLKRFREDLPGIVLLVAGGWLIFVALILLASQ